MNFKKKRYTLLLFSRKEPVYTNERKMCKYQVLVISSVNIVGFQVLMGIPLTITSKVYK